MNTKRILLGVLMIGLAVLPALANGVSESDQAYWGYGRGDRHRGNFAPAATETYSGTYDVEEEWFPVLETDDGKRYYIDVEFPVAAADVPTVGDRLTVEAYRSHKSPVHLSVLSAEVNGVAIEPAWTGWDRWGDHRRGGRRGHGHGHGHRDWW